MFGVQGQVILNTDWYVRAPVTFTIPEKGGDEIRTSDHHVHPVEAFWKTGVAF